MSHVYLHQESNHKTANLPPLVIKAQSTADSRGSDHYTERSCVSPEVVVHGLTEVHVGINYYWITGDFFLMTACDII